MYAWLNVAIFNDLGNKIGDNLGFRYVMHIYLNLQGFCVPQSVIQPAYKLTLESFTIIRFTFNPIRSLEDDI